MAVLTTTASVAKRPCLTLVIATVYVYEKVMQHAPVSVQLPFSVHIPPSSVVDIVTKYVLINNLLFYLILLFIKCPSH